jgi:hypothetical protein
MLPDRPEWQLTAADISRRVNSKRRRDDDFDIVSFKRRAVSPGMSVHNSPVLPSSVPWDNAGWPATGRHNSAGGEKSGPSNDGRPMLLGKVGGRIGFQGMADTHDGLMKMSIE